MPRVSVIVPCFNYGRYLERCVSSIIEQDGVTVQVLIVDDASTDDSAMIADRIAGRDGRVEVLNHPTNKGHIATYNDGLAWASGEYVSLVSADDLLTPGALRRATRLMETDPNIGFVYGRASRFMDGDPLPAVAVDDRSGRSFVGSGHAWVRARCEEGRNCICSPEVVVRTNLQQEVGGYRADLPMSADLEMWLRLAAHGAVGRVSQHQAYYRRHQSSMSTTRFADTLERYTQRLAAFDAVFDDPRNRLPDAEELQGTVHESIARAAIRSAGDAFVEGLPDDRVDELAAFAARCYPPIVTGRHAAGLRIRRRCGRRASRAAVPLVELLTVRRVRDWMRWHARMTKGV